MKPRRTYSLIVFSALALVALLLIQVNWLLKTAQAKEDLFNEKAGMVLARTAEELCSDKETCTNMSNCCINAETPGCIIKLQPGEMHKIDSLLKHFMSYYSLRLDYTFEVRRPGALPEKKNNGNVFVTRLEEVAYRNGLDLKLTLPGKNTFIRQEMGSMFVVSILLIVIIFILFVRTVRSLIREKKIAEHTTDFLNNMTHEFKTPLTNIGLAGKMILKDANLRQEEKVKHYTEIILSENEKLRQQAEQVLSMTALERGEIPLLLTELNMHALIEEAIKCISVQVEAKQGILQTELKAEKHVVTGDLTHLRNTICNLVDNAIKYSKEKPRIKISTSNRENALVIQIADEGIGIDKEHQKDIFTKFFRVPTGDVHDVKGFGLGLAYVKKIVELHNGKIELQSEPGKGSTFILTLPLLHE